MKSGQGQEKGNTSQVRGNKGEKQTYQQKVEVKGEISPPTQPPISLESKPAGTTKAD